MIESAARECRCRMAEVAIQGGGNMILRLAPGRHAMAGLAIIHDSAVIEHRTCESAGVMADTAVLIGSNMPGMLTLGKHAIVTGLTVIDDPGVVKRCRQETGRYVALTAICVGRYVIAMLADGNAAVMARGTIVCNALMVETGARKSLRIVANGAILSGWNMTR